MNDGSLWKKIEPLLSKVEKPVRYIGGELNAVSDGEYAAAKYKAVFCYPDVYDIGQSNYAITILYDIARNIDGVGAARTYLPWDDMAAQMRENDVPLLTLEGHMPVAESDFFGITMPYELCCTNVLEALDLAGLPLHASERSDDMPLVVAGGPLTFNPEPYAEFFDAFLIGEGEEELKEFIEVHRSCKARGLGRAQTLRELAQVDGTYIPSLYVYADDNSNILVPCDDSIPARVHKRVIADLDACPVVVNPVVPYAETVQDRFIVEILRGCTRGCRFCQAGMTGRPVRERSVDTIVRAIAAGIDNTGYDEVSLMSLSSMDHSQITEIVRRLHHELAGRGVKLSLPSQRVDALSVRVAELVAAGEKKGSLTLAPEAGTQRLRDAINKNVTEDDLINAIRAAYEAGWRRTKLYFMMGLPGETDDDIRGIVSLANMAYDAAKDSVPDAQRGRVRMSVSVAVFVPKPATPFQWCGQASLADIEHKVDVLRSAKLHKGIDLHWHEPSTSVVEAALARGGRECAGIIEAAWRDGATFDAWSEKFSMQRWVDAAHGVGLDIERLAARTFALDEPLPWDHIDAGVYKDYLKGEYECSASGQTTGDCSFDECITCGVCQTLPVQTELAGKRHV